MAAATIVVDVLAQCATMGDLHHALAAGKVVLEDLHAELADLVVGRKSGRTPADEITVFDSPGTPCRTSPVPLRSISVPLPEILPVHQLRRSPGRCTWSFDECIPHVGSQWRHSD
jgi:hypothetical protein